MSTTLATILLLTLCSTRLLAQEEAGAVKLHNPGFPGSPILIVDLQGNPQPAPPEGTFAQVLSRPVGSLEPLIVLANEFGNSTFQLELPGYFGVFDEGGIARVPVEPRTSAEFRVRAWRGAPTWEEATMTETALIGQTPVFENPVGYWDSGQQGLHDPARLEKMPSLTLYPVPEPEILHFILLGLVVFWIARASIKA